MQRSVLICVQIVDEFKIGSMVKNRAFCVQTSFFHRGFSVVVLCCVVLFCDVFYVVIGRIYIPRGPRRYCMRYLYERWLESADWLTWGLKIPSRWELNLEFPIDWLRDWLRWLIDWFIHSFTYSCFGWRKLQIIDTDNYKYNVFANVLIYLNFFNLVYHWLRSTCNESVKVFHAESFLENPCYYLPTRTKADFLVHITLRKVWR